jgi:hypothetical protein
MQPRKEFFNNPVRIRIFIRPFQYFQTTLSISCYPVIPWNCSTQRHRHRPYSHRVLSKGQQFPSPSSSTVRYPFQAIKLSVASPRELTIMKFQNCEFLLMPAFQTFSHVLHSFTEATFFQLSTRIIPWRIYAKKLECILESINRINQCISRSGNSRGGSLRCTTFAMSDLSCRFA